MISAALSISCSVMSEPPTTLNTMPRAWSSGKSRSGEAMACDAASSARPLPTPLPMPMRAVPALPMTARTSAKSTFTSPGRTMISEMPTTPWRSTSSATPKACCSGVCSGMICSSLSLDTTMSVSTAFCRFSMACVASRMRRRPSNWNGLLTTPTVSAPASLATSATTGAAPEPVPPPMPAVTKTRSAPATASAISERDSSAAWRPTCGTPPAPSPRVTIAPMLRAFESGWVRASAWASVFTLQKVTPCTSVSIMRVTALPPAPPTPMTLMTQGEAASSGDMVDPRAVPRG
mmetsp:Transcript_6032/g.20278  ORF Transcript_6032/g.20278 Transcript_6032/m.20278 type:complete len:291 (-) Transcript_6032:14-886(-)